MAEKEGEELPEASGPPQVLGPGLGDAKQEATQAKDAADPPPAKEAAAEPEKEEDEPGLPEVDFDALRRELAAEDLPPEAAPVPVAPFSFAVDSASMQGRRPKQEDRHVKIPDLTKAAKALKMPINHLPQPCAFFSVYDGHQGHQCAEFVAKGFHVKLLKRLSSDTNTASWDETRISNALREVCEELDTEFLAKFRTSPDGTTLVVALIVGTKLFTAWVGDSRLVLCQRSQLQQMLAKSLTEDHRPNLEAEAQRVKDAGGLVLDFGMGVYRVAHDGYEEKMREIRRQQVLGMGFAGKEPVALAVSRAIGDRDFKAVTGKGLLVATPDVRCVELDRTHMFMALMCDGITDVMQDDEICAELEMRRPGPPDPVKRCRIACGALVQEAYKRGSEDNLTVIFVRFQWQGGYEEAPLPADHPLAKAMIEAASKGVSAAAASKKRRQEAAASVKRQKVDAYERAIAQQSREASEANGAKAKEEAKAAEATPEPKKEEKEEKEEKDAKAAEEDEDEGLTFL